MNKENNKKYILISDSQWRKLKTEAQINESKYLNRVEDRNTRIQKVSTKIVISEYFTYVYNVKFI